MKCIIVDDEPLARIGINLLVEEYPDIEIVGSFNQAAPALAFMMLNKIDLVFLDIRMPGINGIDFARSINKNSMVIFITAHIEYALDSYEVDAIDYLLKPINTERFHRAVRKALDYESLLKQTNSDSSLEFTPDYIVVRADRQFNKVELQNILFVEGLKDYVILYLTDGERLISNVNLKMIHSELPNEQFIRVSKSYIVNQMHVSTFDNNMITIDNKEIPIGNVYREEFFKRILNKK